MTKKTKQQSPINGQQTTKNSNVQKQISGRNNVLNNNIDKYYFVFILAFLFAVYFQVIHFTYTGFDDDFLVVNNMQKLMNAKFIEVFAGNSFLSDAVSGFYRPLQTITFITDTQIGGGALWVFHLTNLILFCLSSLLLFKLLRKFQFDSSISLIATIVFSLHPLFSVNLGWLPARGDLLVAVFGLASFLQFIFYTESKRILNLIIHFVLLLMAFFSKETAVLIPVLMLSYLILFRKKIISAEIIKLVILWIAGYSLWTFLRFTFSGSLPQNQIFGLIPFFENLRTIPEYISKFILPVHIMPLPVFRLVTTITGLALITLLVVLYWRKKSFYKLRMTGDEKKEKGNQRMLLYWMIWFVMLVLPGMLYSRYYPKSEMFYHYLDHRAFLPMIGILIVILILIEPYLKKINQKKLLTYGLIFSIILSLYSFNQVKTFSNPSVFLTDAIEDNPKAAVVYFLRGNYLKDSGEMEKAINDYTRSVSIDKNYAEAYNNRGSAYGLQGDNIKAINDLTKAIKLEPNIPDGYFNRAIARDATGDLAGAVSDFTKSLRITPNDYLNYFLRGNTLSKLGQTMNALDDYSKAISLNPRYTDAYVNRGIVKYKMNDKAGACSDWKTAAGMGSPQAKQMLEKYCREP